MICLRTYGLAVPSQALCIAVEAAIIGYGQFGVVETHALFHQLGVVETHALFHQLGVVETHALFHQLGARLPLLFFIMFPVPRLKRTTVPY